MRVRKIYLSWRPGTGLRRFLIGELRRNNVEGLTFQYLQMGAELAMKEGFKHYPGLPDISKKYTSEDGIDILFGNRVIDLSRADSQKLLAFWEATDPAYDYFDLLALTQGWIPTDNFEFLGDYYPQPGVTFVTDLANVKSRELLKSDIEGYKFFSFKKEPENEYDHDAVLILNPAGKELGYVKKVHNSFFYKLRGLSPIIQLKAMKANGNVKEIFIKIST